ncbi:hypothetical protein AGOR_G00226910 [Albula goreensis]|uniref:Uncharacterized protein n=1 Tax=Albula goreensis TaxID=1534307 RepID=A0A8T3CHG3_9TELE|nr:hypothetical protein AGOR_G00226910 [Albula goreensis]
MTNYTCFLQLMVVFLGLSGSSAEEIDPCVNYNVLSDPWRNIGYNIITFPGYPLCDSTVYNEVLWTRFTGVAGDVITEKCVQGPHSGSNQAAYLSFAHPQLGEGIKQGNMYVHYGANCLWTSVNGIKVLACPDGYYVYLLPRLSCYRTFAISHRNCSQTSCGPLAECIGDGACACISGYKFSEDILPVNDSYVCEDIDECVNSTICGPNATCTNTIGNYTCTCQLGFSFTSLESVINASNTCQDIEECEEVPTICGPNANCTNTIGSHNCTCQQGFHLILSDSIASASNPCEDVDECEQINCGPNAVCDNIPGIYYCTCQEGYISSTGYIWEFGVTVCTGVQEEIDSLTPPEGQSAEIFFINKMQEELENNPDIILPPGTVTSTLSTAISITENLPPEGEEASSGEAASTVLKLSESLVSALVEPPKIQSRKTVKKPNMEINVHAIGPGWSEASIPSLNVEGNSMTIDLPAIAKNNNGSAAAVLMSVSGMEKLMGPSFFETENVTEMYSDIITATLPKTNHRELPDPVKFTISHKETFQAGMVTCVYWDDKGEEKHWSVDGCTATFSNETHTVCSCTHLSTFAILLQTEEQAEDDELLEWINLICMAVGLVFLGLAILSFLLCSWNPKINNTARLHLSISLFLGHLLFLVGVSRTENEMVCAAIAGLLHFLFLSSFVFMLLETLQLFLLVRSLSQVRVIQKEGLRPLYLLLIGYGAPVVVVGVSGGVYSDGYGSENQCWLKKERSFQWSFIGPVAAILALNLVSFCVVIWCLRPTLANMKSDVSQAKDTRLIIFKIVAQFFILGCTWILGFFQSTTMLKYLFIILNSQQGTFIFIVHCLLNKEVRAEYKSWLSCLFRNEEPSQKGSGSTTCK